MRDSSAPLGPGLLNVGSPALLRVITFEQPPCKCSRSLFLGAREELFVPGRMFLLRRRGCPKSLCAASPSRSCELEQI
jgi:hypothetical protein